MIKASALKMIAVGGVFASMLFFWTSLSAHAQTATPQFLVTWKTSASYVPSFYAGKVLPSYSSKITASFELMSQGKIINIQNQTIYWYLGDVLIGGGTGVQTLTFPAFGDPPNTEELKIQMPNYAGGYLTHVIDIPMVQPQVVLYAPFPNAKFSSNPLVIEALPYFFNASSSTQLSYTWSVNGQTGSAAENPQEVEVTLPAGTGSGANLDVSVSVKNPIGSTIATADSNLIYEQQL